MSLELTTATEQQLSGIRQALKTVSLIGNETISGVKSFQSGDFDNLIINYVLGVGEAKIKFGSKGYLLCNELDPIYTLGGVTPITLDAYNSAITLNNLSVSFNQYDLATYFGNKGEFAHFGLKNKFIHFYDYNSVLDQIEPNTQYNFKSGVSGSIPVDSEVVHKTGDETISGVKTFAQTGSFDTLQITNKKLSSYRYIDSNFGFGDAHINIVNTTNNILGVLPNIVTSGMNYYVKNINSGILFIIGQTTIDGFSTFNLYKNESLHLLGVNNVGYTGWVIVGEGIGVS